MRLLESARSHLDLTHARGIMRRYFVVNGFDGALTMLGLIIGFMAGGVAELSVVINVCLGAAIALSVSGVSSAYVSESAERRRALGDLEEAMLTDLGSTSHGLAARWVPLLVAMINGAAPLLFSLIIITPLWLGSAGMVPELAALTGAVTAAIAIIFILGVYLGRIAGVSWFGSGMRTLLVAGITIVLITMFVGA